MTPDLPTRLRELAEHLDEWNHPITAKQDCLDAADAIERLTRERDEMTDTITLPLPPADLHAHAKGHWRSKQGPTKQCRERAHAEALLSNADHWGDTLSLAFYFPDNRRRDLLNASQGCKPYIDGLVDAGWVTDDCWQAMGIGSITGQIDRENPRVEITVERRKAAGGSV